MLIERFLLYITNERNYSPLTVRSYRTDLEQWRDFVTRSGNTDLISRATPTDIRRWLLVRSQAGDGPLTLRRKTQSLRAFYRYLMKSGEATDNPAAEIDLAKMPKHLPQYVREANMDSLLDSELDENDFTQVRNRLMLMMMYETGIRRAELISLRDVNVDADKCELKVHGKRDKDRIVPFGPELKHYIDMYRHLRNVQVGTVASEFFVRESGKPLYPSLVYKVVHDSLMSVGGSDQKSPHVLRHSFASAMLNSGAGINSVKELLGHQSLAATQIYTHITFGELKDSYKHAHPRALKKGG